MDGKGGATKAAAQAARAQRRQQRMRASVAAAQTPEARLAAAHDWLRSSAGYLGKRAGGSRRAAERAMREATDYLARLAADIDGGRYDHAA